MNKFSTGLFSNTGLVWPVNHEMIDIELDAKGNPKNKTYGKTLKITPVDGEPHNAKLIFASKIKNWNMGQALKGSKELFGGKARSNYMEPAHSAASKHYFIPMDRGRPGITTTKDGVKEIRVKAFSYGYIPRQLRVNKGDKVRLIITNIDRAAGITKNPDVIMGFNIYGPYSLRTMIKAPRGVSAVSEFTADVAGEFEIYCQHFCGPLHLEMRATFFVDDPKEDASSLAQGDYMKAQENHGLVEEGLLEKAKVVENLNQI
jgi:nitrous oxide reductase